MQDGPNDEGEVDQRRDEIARRMLRTPPKPHKRKKDEDGREAAARYLAMMSQRIGYPEITEGERKENCERIVRSMMEKDLFPLSLE